MKKVLRNDNNVKATVHRDAHNPGVVYLETDINDTKALERNKAIRNEGLLPANSRNPLVDGDVIGYAFSFPTVKSYELVCKAEPELMHIAQKGNYDERMKAAHQLSILYPQYVITQHKKRLF